MRKVWRDLCLASWCHRLSHVRWYCSLHRKMAYTDKCSIEWCNLIAESKCLCSKHYTRLKRWQDVIWSTDRDKRPAIIEWDIAKIPLWVNAKDWYAIVDKEFSYLDKYNWCLQQEKWYAVRRCKDTDRLIKLHHMIIWKPSKPNVIDHIDRNKLNNRLSNLRDTSKTINSYKRTIWKNNKSWHIWIYWYKNYGKRKSEIWIWWKNIFIWYFENMEDAIQARDKKEIEIYWFNS